MSLSNVLPVCVRPLKSVSITKGVPRGHEGSRWKVLAVSPAWDPLAPYEVGRSSFRPFREIPKRANDSVPSAPLAPLYLLKMSRDLAKMGTVSQMCRILSSVPAFLPAGHLAGDALCPINLAHFSCSFKTQLKYYFFCEAFPPSLFHCKSCKGPVPAPPPTRPPAPGLWILT